MSSAPTELIVKGLFAAKCGPYQPSESPDAISLHRRLRRLHHLHSPPRPRHKPQPHLPDRRISACRIRDPIHHPPRTPPLPRRRTPKSGPISTQYPSGTSNPCSPSAKNASSARRVGVAAPKSTRSQSSSGAEAARAGRGVPAVARAGLAVEHEAAVGGVVELRGGRAGGGTVARGESVSAWSWTEMARTRSGWEVDEEARRGREGSCGGTVDFDDETRVP